MLYSIIQFIPSRFVWLWFDVMHDISATEHSRASSRVASKVLTLVKHPRYEQLGIVNVPKEPKPRSSQISHVLGKNVKHWSIHSFYIGRLWFDVIFAEQSSISSRVVSKVLTIVVHPSYGHQGIFNMQKNHNLGAMTPCTRRLCKSREMPIYVWSKSLILIKKSPTGEQFLNQVAHRRMVGQHVINIKGPGQNIQIQNSTLQKCPNFYINLCHRNFIDTGPPTLIARYSIYRLPQRA